MKIISSKINNNKILFGFRMFHFYKSWRRGSAKNYYPAADDD